MPATYPPVRHATPTAGPDPSVGAPRHTRWARAGWWVLPPLVLAILGGWVVARQHGLWYDELYTAEVAPVPVGDLLSAILHGEGTISYLADAPPRTTARTTWSPICG